MAHLIATHNAGPEGVSGAGARDGAAELEAAGPAGVDAGPAEVNVENMERVTIEHMRAVAERIRQARLKAPLCSRERARKLFEEHRQAAQRSRLALRVETDGKARG